MKDFKGREVDIDSCVFPVNLIRLEDALNQSRIQEDGYTMSVIGMLEQIDTWFDGDRKAPLTVSCITL